MNRTPMELLNELGDVVKSFNILGMTDYMGCDPSIYNIWKKRKALPYRNVKKIVEYLEMHNDDVITLCGHLMEYYNAEKKKRDDKLEATRERNRIKAKERSRERHLYLKQKEECGNEKK